MLICHCRRVNDHTIRELARQGALSREEVADHCGAGSRCGGCRPAIDEILAEESPAPVAGHLPVLSADAPSAR